jgi:multidrug efflux pump
MKFTDLFIRRPVLATVVSLVLLVLGLRSLSTLPVLQFPRTENAVVTVSTAYYGADPDLIAGFITTPLESAIAQANGIDYMTSTSRSGVSTITVNLRLNFDVDKALTEISAKVSAVLNQLPPEAQRPVMSVQIGQTIDAMYIGFASDVLPSNNITDYLIRVVQPKLQAVEGVQTAELIGSKYFALRAWMDPDKLAAYGLTATDVRDALSRNDYLAGLGNSKGQMVQVNLTASTSLHSVEEFRELVVKREGGAIVRLKDVANVTLGADDYESQVGFDGNKAVYIGIQIAPGANLLEVIDRIRTVFPEIQAQLPSGITGAIVYDSTKFVNSSIREVVHTLVEALAIVTLVVFSFLGSPRSVLIPVVAIPLSLIGTFTMMLAFGFSINLLTLLALVLAIGLVVDDAIIVVENVNRHLEEGMSPVAAACRAARELAGPIIAMTIVLVAVYVPIGFQAGLTGALFTEFAFTLVGAVTVSAIVALTLSPMMCSKLLRGHGNLSPSPPGRGVGVREEGSGVPTDALEAESVHSPNPNHLPEGERVKRNWEDKLVAQIDRVFEAFRRLYSRGLHDTLDHLPVTTVFAVIILGAIYFLYAGTTSELAPQEDQGVVITFSTAAPNATLQQRQLYSRKIFDIFKTHAETDHIFQLDVPGQSIAGMVLKPWDDRRQTSHQLQPVIQQEANGIAGLKVAAFQPPPLPGARGLPVQFVIGATEPFERLNEVAQGFAAEAMKSGMFMFLDNDLKIDQPQARVEIDRDKAALMGLDMRDVGGALSSMLGGGYVNYFSLSGRSYKVIPQVQQRFRLNPDQLENYYLRSGDGQSVPVSTVAKLKMETVPQSLNHFQQLNAATISGVPFPGVSMGDALAYLKDLAARTLPSGYSVDYSGQSRQMIQESSGFLTTFAFALIIIFLALAAQFESFRDPFIILVSVPMSIAGALIFINLGIGGATLNIYTQVGLVTLMGLISKHGILIVEFANVLQEKGRSKRDAIEEAAGIRLRPILMTTAAMVLGVAPLIAASGAGAVSRFNMGLVIASGIAIGTLFTLFVVPAVYMMLGHNEATQPKKEALPEFLTGEG